MVNCDSSQVNNLTRKSFAEYWFNASLKQQNISTPHYPCSISLYLGQFIYSPLSKEQAHISTWIVSLQCTVFNSVMKFLFGIMLLWWNILFYRYFSILELKIYRNFIKISDTIIIIFVKMHPCHIRTYTVSKICPLYFDLIVQSQNSTVYQLRLERLRSGQSLGRQCRRTEGGTKRRKECSFSFLYLRIEWKSLILYYSLVYYPK